MKGAIHSINVSGSGGVPKVSVKGTMVNFEGLEGDHNRYRTERKAGDPGRAVCIFSLERIRELRREGHPIDIGTAGENLTIEGLDWPALRVGMTLRVGDAAIRLSEPCAPCSKIGASFQRGDFSRVDHEKQEGWSRWSASVVEEGAVSVSDSVYLIDSQ